MRLIFYRVWESTRHSIKHPNLHHPHITPSLNLDNRLNKAILKFLVIKSVFIYLSINPLNPIS